MERKDEYQKTLEEIKKENEKKQKEAKAILSKTSALKKEIETAQEILKELKAIDPKTILFSEPLPKKLTRNNKINGTIPVKKLQACAYKGNIYYIIEGEKESVKGIRIGDDIIEGQVPIYSIERKEEDGRYHITKVRPTEEKQFLRNPGNKKSKSTTRTKTKKYISKYDRQNDGKQRTAYKITLE